jgi:hypothetical protein
MADVAPSRRVIVQKLTVNGGRLWRSLMETAVIGGTPKGASKG